MTGEDPYQFAHRDHDARPKIERQHPPAGPVAIVQSFDRHQNAGHGREREDGHAALHRNRVGLARKADAVRNDRRDDINEQGQPEPRAIDPASKAEQQFCQAHASAPIALSLSFAETHLNRWLELMPRH
jgi:hypothetical protein